MRQEFRLPDPGEGLTEAEILVWRVAVGDEVEVNQVLLEVETAKAAVELPSPWAGTVAERLVEPGQVVPVGTPIIRLDERVKQDGEQEHEPAIGQEAVLVGYGVREASTPRRRPRVTPHGVAHVEPGPPGAAARPVRHGGLETARAVESRLSVSSADPTPPPLRRAATPPGSISELSDAAAERSEAAPRAKPPVRRLASELGVDLRTIRPTGPAGTITHDDVMAGVASRAVEGAFSSPPDDGPGVMDATPAPKSEQATPRVDMSTPTTPDLPAASSAGGTTSLEPLTHVQRRMADAMTRSAFTAPHVTEWLDVDVSETMRLITAARSRRGPDDAPITPLTVAALGLVRAVRRLPRINATFTDEGLLLHREIHLGIAVNTARGLLVPNVRNAQGLDLRAMAQAIALAVGKLRSGAATPQDLVGSTVTITNVGSLGVDAGTPIINPGEVAILSLGRVRPRPWAVEGEVSVRDVATLALSFDHRVIDGAMAATALNVVASFMMDPAVELLVTPPEAG